MPPRRQRGPRCNPCIQFGTRCDKKHPTCTACTRRGSEEDCYGQGNVTPPPHEHEREPEPDREPEPEHEPEREPEPQPRPENDRRGAPPGKTVEAYEYPLGHTVRKILEGGWNVHIPWTHTTDNYCQSHAHSSKLDNTVKVSGDGQIIISDTLALSSDGEDSLPFDQWFSGYKRVLPALLEYPSLAEEQPLWEAHFNRIVSKPQLTKFWPVYQAYDIRICILALTTDIDPSMEHKDILDPLMAEFYAKLASANSSSITSSNIPSSLSSLSKRVQSPSPTHPPRRAPKPYRLLDASFVEIKATAAQGPVTAKAHSTLHFKTRNGYSPQANASAMSTTVLKVAHARIAPLDSTSAHSVATAPTVVSHSYDDVQAYLGVIVLC